MLQTPVFKRNFTIRTTADDSVFFLNEHEHKVLKGAMFARIVELADGTNTWDDIIAELSESFPLPKALSIMSNLEKKGYLVEKELTISDSEAAWWDYLNVSPSLAQQRIQSTPLNITILDDAIPFEEAKEPFERAGFPITDDPNAVRVVFTKNYLHPALEEINTQAQQNNTPWMLVKPAGVSFWVGPLFYPNETGCWQCLAKRLTDNSQVEAFLTRTSEKEFPVRSRALSEPSLQFALGFAATELSKAIAQQQDYHGLRGNIISYDLTTLAQRKHILTKRPQCPTCGNPEFIEPRPFEPLKLSPVPPLKDYTAGHRSEPPQVTCARLEKHVSPITGVVTHLERLSEENTPLINTYLAGHNFAIPIDNLFYLTLNLRGRSGGKGISDAHARASAICESIERFCGMYPQTAHVEESFTNLSTSQELTVHHPRDLILFSENQYETRNEWNKKQSGSQYHFVPRKFTDNETISWSKAWSLTHEKPAYLPTAYCYYGFRDSNKDIPILPDSNGSAAGNSLEEALLQGLMELVERDSVSIWWYNKLQRPEVDLASFNDPYILRLIDYYKSINREIWAIDITSDLGIPTVVGVSRRTDREPEDIIFGFGCHTDIRVALLRALTEVNQFLPAVDKMHPDGSTRYWFPDMEALEWWQSATIASHPYLLPNKDVPATRWYPENAQLFTDMKEEIDHCRSRIEEAGMEVLAIDMTHPDIELNVAKVVVPGLNHYWKRLGGERIYSVPVKMGWLDKPYREDELNTSNIFF